MCFSSIQIWVWVWIVNHSSSFGSKSPNFSCLFRFSPCNLHLDRIEETIVAFTQPPSLMARIIADCRSASWEGPFMPPLRLNGRRHRWSFFISLQPKKSELLKLISFGFKRQNRIWYDIDGIVVKTLMRKNGIGSEMKTFLPFVRSIEKFGKEFQRNRPAIEVEMKTKLLN